MTKNSASRHDQFVGEWMLLMDAASYADVSLATLHAAIANGELLSRQVYSYGRGRDALAVHSRDLEGWATSRVRPASS